MAMLDGSEHTYGRPILRSPRSRSRLEAPSQQKFSANALYRSRLLMFTRPMTSLTTSRTTWKSRPGTSTSHSRRRTSRTSMT